MLLANRSPGAGSRYGLRSKPESLPQSGMSGSSPQIADPALLAAADPALLATEKEELTLALSVDRYTSRSTVNLGGPDKAGPISL